MSQKINIPTDSAIKIRDGEQPSDTPAENELTKDTQFQLLGNRRRRWVIGYLLNEERVKLGDLAVQLAAWEHQTSATQVTSRQRKCTYTALQQRHLPALAEADVIDYTPESGVVEVTERIQTFDIYLEVVPDRNIPWSVYYLGMGVVSCVVVGLSTVLEGGLFAMIPDIGWAALIAGTITVSASAHTYLTRSMRVDTQPSGIDEPEPPEGDSEHE